MATFQAATSPHVTQANNSHDELLQPDVESHSEPHPLAFFSAYNALTDKGDLPDYLGTCFTRHSDGSLSMTQPKMIKRVLSIVGLDPQSEHVQMHDTPASDSKPLGKDPNGQPRRQKRNYSSEVGCLSNIQAMIWPDITMAVQQCATSYGYPTHEEAVKRTEFQDCHCDLHRGVTKVVCRTFKDNRSCIEIATNHKTRPRTKHLSARLHYFRSHIIAKTITIKHISTIYLQSRSHAPSSSSFATNSCPGPEPRIARE